MEELLGDIICLVGGCTDCANVATCAYLKFGLICMFFGTLCVLADYLVFKIRGESYLKLGYLKGVFFIFIFWILGAFIIGFIGGATGIFDTSKLLSGLFVGIAWPLIFARWSAGKLDSEDEQPANAM